MILSFWPLRMDGCLEVYAETKPFGVSVHFREHVVGILSNGCCEELGQSYTFINWWDALCKHRIVPCTSSQLTWCVHFHAKPSEVVIHNSYFLWMRMKPMWSPKTFLQINMILESGTLQQAINVFIFYSNSLFIISQMAKKQTGDICM